MNNYIKVKVEGKNINNYINWLIKNKIEVSKINIIKHNELEIVLNNKYYKKLFKYSKTYKISIIKKYGQIKIFEIITTNLPIITGLIISIILLYILSKMIFSVKIIYNDKKIVAIMEKELKKYNITKYKKKKSDKYLNYVEEKILENNKDILEWIEIEEKGTTYIVKIVERKKEIIEKNFLYQSIVAKKDDVITNIKAYSGEKNKSINQYIRKGEVIINGILTKSNNEKIYTKASGYIEGEVWYKVKVEYPLHYKEEKITGKSKKTPTINFFNLELPILPYSKYKSFKFKNHNILENNFIPISLSIKKIYETKIEEQIYTQEEAIEKAKIEVKNKLLKRNINIIKINKIEILKKKNLNSKIELELFVSVIENITDIIELIPEEKLP